MNPIKLPEVELHAIPSTEELLRRLCEIQGKRIAELAAELKDAEETAGYYERKGQREAEEWHTEKNRLSGICHQHLIESMKYQRERDQLAIALRALWNAVASFSANITPLPNGSPVQRAMREVNELLAVLDQKVKVSIDCPDWTVHDENPPPAPPPPKTAS